VFPTAGQAVSTPDRPTPSRQAVEPVRNRRRLPIGQIVCVESAIAGVIASIGRPLPVLIGVSVVAVLVLVLAATKWRQRWLYQWIGVYARYIVRDRSRSGDPADRPRALLDAVAGGATLGSVEVDDDEIGIIEHAGGITALLEPVPTESGLVTERAAKLPSPASLLPVGEPGDPVVSAQLVVESVPAPLPGSESSAPGTSYHQLTAGRVPAARRAWIAIQVLRTVDGHSDAELRHTLSSAVRRLAKRFRKDGTPLRALDPNEAGSVLVTLAHLDAVGAGPGAATVRESWRSWSAGPFPQACFRIRRWPSPGTPNSNQLVERLLAAPSNGTVVALAARRAARGIEIEAVVRVLAADDAHLIALSDRISSEAAACGAQVERLDGEQVYGVAASLPLGGFLP
jgi:type VII secretion protein EccE